MKNKLSKIFILTGVLAILAGAGFLTYNTVYDYMAGKRAAELLELMMTDLEIELPPLDEMISTPLPLDIVEPDVYSPYLRDPNIELDIESPVYGGTYIVYNPPTPAEPKPTPVYSTIGILSIPKLGVRLPIISECTDELLKISACRISGLANEKPNRLVISGHNIKSHFKGLDTLSVGDEIAFTTVSGVTYYYGATEFVDLHKTQGADVLATDGWDITLITCKTDNTYRTVVRFAEIEK